MRFRLMMAVAALAAAAALPAGAAPRHDASRHEPEASGGPSALGKFADWTAARYQRAGQTVCYAFTRAKSSQPAEPGAASLLTVTERPASRDEVAISAGAPYPKDASITLQVGQTELDFYTAGKDAFARDGKAAVAALRRGGQAIARGPGVHAARVIDTFSLQGFAPAYEVITKTCPAH